MTASNLCFCEPVFLESRCSDFSCLSDKAALTHVAVTLQSILDEHAAEVSLGPQGPRPSSPLWTQDIDAIEAYANMLFDDRPGPRVETPTVLLALDYALTSAESVFLLVNELRRREAILNRDITADIVACALERQAAES